LTECNIQILEIDNYFTNILIQKCSNRIYFYKYFINTDKVKEDLTDYLAD